MARRTNRITSPKHTPPAESSAENEREVADNNDLPKETGNPTPLTTPEEPQDGQLEERAAASVPQSLTPVQSSSKRKMNQSNLDAFVIDDIEDTSVDLHTVLDNLLLDAARQKSFLGHPRLLTNMMWQETISNKCVLVQSGVGDPAVFWTVGEIDTNQYWLYADGSWNRRILGSFTNHAATACIRVPTDTRLHKPFHDGIQGATRIAQFNKESGIMIGTPLLNGHRLRIRHAILKDTDALPIEDRDDARSDTTMSDATLSDDDIIEEQWERLRLEWTIENMPCLGEDSKYERDKLVDNPTLRQRYELNLLPAYDVDGMPIAPPDYERLLKGATVKVMFTISRWLIAKGGDRRYVFNANVEAIWVLDRPSKPKDSPSGVAVRAGNPWKKRKRT